jgi:thiamine pyrophosphate-dependent acetolactate synthase large subunit-like protein
MLAMQIEVRDGTLTVDQLIKKNQDAKPNRENQQFSVKLADREGEIIVEADKALDLLKGEGTAVAFPEVFQQVREDMIHVQRRLNGTDVGSITVGIENDIIATLEEMIKALEKQQQQLDQKKSKQGQPQQQQQQQQDQKLLDQIAELKMIRAMQMRVNNRTAEYGKTYTGEQAREANIVRELNNLGDRQERIFEITRKIAQENAGR